MTEIECPSCKTKHKTEINFCKNCRYDIKKKKAVPKGENKDKIGNKVCSKCKHKNVDSKFCIMCGNVLLLDLLIQCPKCNQLNNNEAKFCSRCAENLEQQENVIACPKCKHENITPAKFCLNCGTELDAEITFCQSCGSKNHLEAKFCISCGKNVKKKPENCPKCGSTIMKEMKFCMSCGTNVEG